MSQTLKEFMETYDGFDFNNGTVVLIKLESGMSYIIEKDSCWKFLIEEYSDKAVWHWTHTHNIMCITINC